jgi:hypothetical protein
VEHEGAILALFFSVLFDFFGQITSELWDVPIGVALSPVR